MLRIILFATLIFVFAIFWTDALAEEAKVIYTDGSREGKLDIVTIDEVTYISAISLGRQFDGLQLPYWNPLTKKMVLRIGDSRITLTAFSPLIIVDDNSFNLSLPSLLHQGSVYVPAKTFVHFLSKTVPGKLQWQDKFKTLVVETSVSNISSLRIEERTNGTIVFIYTEKDFKLEEIEDYTSKPKWLHLIVSGGSLDPSDELLYFVFVQQQFSDPFRIVVVHSALFVCAYVHVVKVYLSLFNPCWLSPVLRILPQCLLALFRLQLRRL